MRRALHENKSIVNKMRHWTQNIFRQSKKRTSAFWKYELTNSRVAADTQKNEENEDTYFFQNKKAIVCHRWPRRFCPILRL